MRQIHFVLVQSPTLRRARGLALTSLRERKHAVTIGDSKIPSGHAGAYLFAEAGFKHGVHQARMLQAASLLSVYTMLENIFSRTSVTNAREFEEKYLHNPDAFKKDFAAAFKFMGECAADVLIDRRCPVAVPGEDWTRGEFNQEGFFSGLDSMCSLKKLMRGDYFTESYFFDVEGQSALIPSDSELELLSTTAEIEGQVLALVPVSIEMFDEN